ncbi:MAG: argininosuccinate lyase [Anaerolineaceae bacterium]|nr:argininosuccinate lyase [Anaerolineaceae bacterium]
MKLWGGRFRKEQDSLMRRYNDSFRFDQQLYKVDIEGSIAYAKALFRIGLLNKEEVTEIGNGLLRIAKEFDDQVFEPSPEDEDIHTAVERRLTELIGKTAGKLHTGRSRNDQVALDLRLYVMGAVEHVCEALSLLQAAIIDKAEAHLGIIMPGYTHLQPAQPVLFSHWIMSFFWMFERDKDRLADCKKRTAISPLGSGALAGNPFPIDRYKLAEDLGMHSVTMNSMDAVSDRDFVAEFLFSIAMISIHISRLAEDLIIFSNPSFGYISIDETYATGSSLMPQKRNPDSLDLARGKSGRAISALVNILVVLKGMPSTYNKDLQEDKEPLFDSLENVLITLPIITGVLETIEIHAESMKANLDESMLATDLADYLVNQGVPFREAHHIVGDVIQLAEERGIDLSDIPLGDLQNISTHFDADTKNVFDFQQSVNKRNGAGGTSFESVKQQISQAKQK